MGKLLKRSIGMRIILSLFALAVSLVFLGAGANQVKEECSDRKLSRKAESERWQSILLKMSEEVPESHRIEWLRIASKRPELLLKLTGFYQK
jgi:hypothetical protein